MSNRRYAKNSALIFVLKGLIPYSRENMLLSFSPNRFFNDLERTSGYRQQTLKHAYWRACRLGFVEENESITRLTTRGLGEIRPFTAKRLGKNASLMVIFDVPEHESHKRQQFRNLLKSLGFKQIQKSVWATNLNYVSILSDAIYELGLDDYVEVYESLRVLPNPK